jgi:hypothetical protein
VKSARPLTCDQGARLGARRCSHWAAVGARSGLLDGTTGGAGGGTAARSERWLVGRAPSLGKAYWPWEPGQPQRPRFPVAGLAWDATGALGRVRRASRGGTHTEETADASRIGPHGPAAYEVRVGSHSRSLPPILIRKPLFVHECRREAGLRNDVT